jgi:hypothetical protein
MKLGARLARLTTVGGTWSDSTCPGGHGNFMYISTGCRAGVLAPDAAQVGVRQFVVSLFNGNTRRRGGADSSSCSRHGGGGNGRRNRTRRRILELFPPRQREPGGRHTEAWQVRKCATALTQWGPHSARTPLLFCRTPGFPCRLAVPLRCRKAVAQAGCVANRRWRKYSRYEGYAVTPGLPALRSKSAPAAPANRPRKWRPGSPFVRPAFGPMTGSFLGGCFHSDLLCAFRRM